MYNAQQAKTCHASNLPVVLAFQLSSHSCRMRCSSRHAAGQVVATGTTESRKSSSNQIVVVVEVVVAVVVVVAVLLLIVVVLVVVYQEYGIANFNKLYIDISNMQYGSIERVVSSILLCIVLCIYILTKRLQECITRGNRIDCFGLFIGVVLNPDDCRSIPSTPHVRNKPGFSVFSPGTCIPLARCLSSQFAQTTCQEVGLVTGWTERRPLQTTAFTVNTAALLLPVDMETGR